MTEYGGDKDTVRDDGQIYDALLMRLWAEWDHIKNGPYAAQASNWDLLWVSPKGGKRESRRLLGDHVLTQTDLEAGRRFADDIAYGGHNLDDHRPLPSGHTEIHGHSIPPLYGIPLRACYSRNIDNLLMAGRLISATHLAHASLRVMRTGAAVGQGVGTAAALCVRHRCTPRELARDGVDELQDELLRADASLLCRPLPPGGDLARRATVTASSQWTFNRSLEPADGLPVLHCLGALLYTWQERLDSVELYLKNCAGTAQDVKLGILRTTRTPPWRPTDHWCKLDRTRLPAAGFVRLAETASRLPAGFAGWHRLRLKQALAPKDPASDDDALLVCLEAPPAVLWCRAQETVEHAELWELVAGDDHWRPLPASPALRLHPEPPLGEAAHVTDGYGRRFSTGPLHMWVSARSAMPQHVMLSWPRPVAFSRVAIRFDNLARRMLDNPWEHGPRVLPYLVKDYALDAWRNGRWSPIVAVADNFRRFRVHEFRPLSTPRLRLRILAMHGEGERARVYEIGVFRA